MTKPLNFQQIIMTLQQYWADLGFLIWQPYHEAVGAGTANPATILRVLGPEPWNVGYVEPSFRPDDGRFGDNPNRMQMHHQFQVIIQPDPGNPQELYLNSLFALGLKQAEHDIRFVEDNWESPALGAWGLGWEVWLDGMEISQYTYFQQSGGHELDPVAVELTYGLERIAMYLQGVNRVWDIDWDGQQTYGDILLRQEIEFCEYEFNVADVDGLVNAYNFYEAECKRCLAKGLVIPAHDYVLKCSHTFNILDTRGAIGVTERAGYFGRMRNMSRQVAQAFIQQREQLEFPLMKYMPERPKQGTAATSAKTDKPETFLLEIGSEELPYHDVTAAINHLEKAIPEFLADLRLTYQSIKVIGSPRRLAIIVEALSPQQTDLEEIARGPAVKIAYDAEGNPTKAALGFARGKGVEVTELQQQTFNGKVHIVAVVKTAGKPTAEVLTEAIPELIRKIPFGRSMRWLPSAQVGETVAKTSYSRPLRWFVSLLGEQVIPFEYAGLISGRTSIGLRPEGSPEIEITQASAYLDIMTNHHVMVDHEQRQATIKNQLDALAGEVGGIVLDDPALLEEVTHLVEQPTALIGSFGEEYLALPKPILVTVMKKHQRYFPVISRVDDSLMPYFITVRNGGTEHLATVRRGNEGVLRARYADANFFFKADSDKTLADFLARLDTLTFQEKLGSMLDKSKRLETLAPQIGEQLGLSTAELEILKRASHLCKADLATNMVVELTSLQGVMGYEYAKRSGEIEAVAEAIVEHYYPQAKLPHETISRPGLALNMANRLDSLCGLFAVGKAPSGSADPFALRRDALSLVTLLIENQVDFDTSVGLQLAADLLPVQVSEQSLQETADFIQRRLEGVLRDEYNLPHDVVQAVLAEQGNNPWLALTIAQDLVAAIQQDSWDAILTAYARCVRIVRKLDETYSVTPALLTEPSEQALYQAYQHIQTTLAENCSMAQVIEAIETHLVTPINQFFDNVMVMVEDETVRNNRLGLLQSIRDLTKNYADFSHLQGF